MTFEELQRDFGPALRTDLKQARGIALSCARLAARECDPLRESEARFMRAEVDYGTGRLVDAVAGYSAARKVFARLGTRRHVLASDVGALQANALLGNATEVRRYVRSMRRRVTDPVQAAVVENAIGTAFNALGNERAAEDSFRRALAHLRKTRTPASAGVRANARHNLGIRLARRGAVSGALRELDVALAFYLDRGLTRSVDLARFNRGWARAVAGNALEALMDLRDAQQAFRKSGDPRLEALALLDEAELTLRLGDTAAAGRDSKVAARMLSKQRCFLEAARARLVTARAAAAAGRRGPARQAARQAREAFRRAGDAAGRAMASVLLREGLGRAEETLRRTGHWIGALDALIERARSASPSQGARLLAKRAPLYPPALRRWVLPELYRLRAKAGGSDRIPLLRRAFRAAEKLRRRAPTGSLRAMTLGACLGSYEALAAALLKRDRPSDRREAFLVLDAARARTLREEMERETPSLTESSAVRTLRKRLEALWRALESRDGESGDLRASEVGLLREVAECERQLIDAFRRAEQMSPGAHANGKLPPMPCIAFSVVTDEVVGLLSRDGEVTSWSCGPLADLRRELERFHFQVTRRLFGATDSDVALDCLARLSRRLLRGTEQDWAPPHLLAILPPELGALPIEALPVQGRPLLETTVVSHVPSAFGRASRWSREGKALLVGIADENLPAVQEEISFVRRQLTRTHVLQQEEATREAILAALPECGVVHLAGHARASEDLPLLNALRVRDGWITAHDLRGQPLRHATVVLSACRTGDPSLRWHGEAMGGFPRALLAAGAACIVASRWEIPDEIAHAWMREFYCFLKKHPPQTALALSARRMLQFDEHPAHWASFLHIGWATQ